VKLPYVWTQASAAATKSVYPVSRLYWPDVLVSELRPLGCGLAGLDLLSCVQIDCITYVLNSVECTTQYCITNHKFNCHLILFDGLHLQAVNATNGGKAENGGSLQECTIVDCSCICPAWQHRKEDQD